jgi:hypothetical protein
MVFVVFERNPDGTKGRWMHSDDLVRSSEPPSPERLANLRSLVYPPGKYCWVLYLNGPRSYQLAESNPELFDEITTDVKVLKPINISRLREIICDDKARSWLREEALRELYPGIMTDEPVLKKHFDSPIWPSY